MVFSCVIIVSGVCDVDMSGLFLEPFRYNDFNTNLLRKGGFFKLRLDWCRNTAGMKKGLHMREVGT